MSRRGLFGAESEEKGAAWADLVPERVAIVSVKDGGRKMSTRDESLSRRKALGLLGLAAMTAYATPTALSLSNAQARTRRRTDRFRRRTDRRRRRTDRFFFRRPTDRRLRRRTDRRRYW